MRTYNIFQAPRLTKPVQVYDQTKSVQENMEGNGKPSPQNIVNAYGKPKGEKAEVPAANAAGTAAVNGTVPQQRENKPQGFTGDQTSSTAGMDYLNSLYTDPEEEERLRKASVMNRRILAIGDAVRHIGNIAYTVGGAPSQQFNDPVALEQARYERGKAIRDRANQWYMTYQQQKAAQDAAQKKWEQQYGLQAANAASQAAYRQEQARIAAERAANQKAYQEGNLARQTKADEARNKYNEARLKQDRWYKGASLGIQGRRLQDQERRTTAILNRQNGAGVSGVAPLDTPKGQITPNGRNYSNQLLQMFDYARSQGYVQESDAAKRLRELGFGNDQSDNVKRQMVMDLLRTNQDMGDYASSRLGWSYGLLPAGTTDENNEDNWDEYLVNDDEEDDWNNYIE